MSKEKQQADRLNQYIDKQVDANQAVDEASKRVVEALRQQVAQTQPRPRFVEDLSHRLQAEANNRSTFRSWAAWMATRFVPRLLWLGIGVGIVALLVMWVSNLFPPQPELEPASNADTAVTSAIEPFTIPDSPAELPLYEIEYDPIAATPEEALAWAEIFGIPDAVVYTSHNGPSPGLIVIGSDGQTLSFEPYMPGSMFYYDNTNIDREALAGEPLPFAAAADIATAFLAERNLLPQPYQVFASAEQSFANDVPVHQIQVSPDLEGYVLHGNISTPVASFHIGPDGQILSLTLTPIQGVSKGEMVAIKPAQTVYEAFLDGMANPFRTSTSYLGSPVEEVQHFQPPAPEYVIGDEVEVVGWGDVLTAVDGNEVRVTVHDRTGTTYRLVGPAVSELADAPPMSELHIQGTITAVDAGGTWQLEVASLEIGPSALSSYAPAPDPIECFVGTFSREGDEGWFEADEGDGRYRIPDAPEELNNDDRILICGEVPENDDLDFSWIDISTPPASETEMGYGQQGGVTEVVEVVEEVAVTRVVTETLANDAATEVAVEFLPPVSEGAATGIEPALTVSGGGYQIGETVTITGVIDAVIYAEGPGNEAEQITEVHIQLEDESGLGSLAVYPLISSEETLADIAGQYYGRYLTITGTVMPMPGDRWGPNAQGIEIDTFAPAWPDTRLQNFLGHRSLETFDGVEALVFTDHATDQQYITAWGGPFHPELDQAIQDATQILVTGIIHPEKTVAGLPVMSIRSMQRSSGIEAAADVSEFPLQMEPPVIARPFSSPGPIEGGDESVVIERMVLVYWAETASEASPGQQIAEPVWVIYGRDADNTKTFSVYIRAVEE